VKRVAWDGVVSRTPVWMSLRIVCKRLDGWLGLMETTTPPALRTVEGEVVS